MLLPINATEIKSFFADNGLKVIRNFRTDSVRIKSKRGSTEHVDADFHMDAFNSMVQVEIYMGNGETRAFGMLSDGLAMKVIPTKMVNGERGYDRANSFVVHFQ